MSSARLRDFCAGNPDIIAWLQEHDLDPSQVALGDSQGPFIDGDHMTAQLYLADNEGRRFIDPATGAAAVEVRTIKLMRPPPDLLATDGHPFPATVPA